ncbi:MAG: electron transport complex subunit RsxC [Thiobacillaceae bacterium]
MREVYRFNGGVHPAEHKSESASKPIHPAFIPKKLIVPLRQHIGQPAKPIAAVGEHVLKGQMIGKAEGYVSTAIHAPTSGTVTAISMQTVPHPSGLPDLCITIESDGKDEWIEHYPIDYLNLDPSALRDQLRDMGLAGLGGAVFPSFIKLDPGTPPAIRTLILNGGECEPWITCDDRLMQERAEEILQGAIVMHHMLQSTEVLAGIEDNKPAAIDAMTVAAKALPFDVEVVTMPTIYPGGGGKQIVKTLLNLDTPSGGRSTDIGVQVFNVGTAYALARAVFHGEPLISRLVTVTGHVLRPQNFEVLIGTPMDELMIHAGERDGLTGIIMGGPMMGIQVRSPHVPVVKATNCLLAMSDELLPPRPKPMPCIRCGACAQACPADLQPQDLYWFAKSRNFGRAQELHLFDCIECGCCTYVCPSHIPLVDFYHFAKSEIWAREKEKNAADLARQRHEFRLFREEREKHERAEKHAAKFQSKKEDLAAAGTSIDAEAAKKKALIDAALARAKAKKEGVTPKNTESLTDEQRREIQEIEARRAKIREIAKLPVEPEQH